MQAQVSMATNIPNGESFIWSLEDPEERRQIEIISLWIQFLLQ